MIFVILSICTCLKAHAILGEFSNITCNVNQSLYSHSYNYLPILILENEIFVYKIIWQSADSNNSIHRKQKTDTRTEPRTTAQFNKSSTWPQSGKNKINQKVLCCNLWNIKEEWREAGMLMITTTMWWWCWWWWWWQ